VAIALTPCPDCGATFPELDGPTHPYIGGSPACWAAFGALSARELALGINGPDRLSVHAYTAQHPGEEGPRAAQSVDVHLMVLCVVLERGWTVARAVAEMTRWLRHTSVAPWLRPVRPVGAVTLQSVPLDADQPTTEAAVRRWADAVWEAWRLVQPTVRGWVDAGRLG
jgi:hypothetical protein